MNSILILKCNKCSAKIEIDYKFCSKCGTSLDVECSKCLMRADSSMNFCTNCGEKMIKSNRCVNHNSTIKQSSFYNRNLKANNSIKHLQVICKVNILFGEEFKEIKQDEGGGIRIIYLYKTDKFFDIKQKIIDIYFPS
jgi:hypothetical protein